MQSIAHSTRALNNLRLQDAIPFSPDRQRWQAIFLTSKMDVFFFMHRNWSLYINPFWERIQYLHLVKSAGSLSNSLAHLSYDTEQAL